MKKTVLTILALISLQAMAADESKIRVIEEGEYKNTLKFAYSGQAAQVTYVWSNFLDLTMTAGTVSGEDTFFVAPQIGVDFNPVDDSGWYFSAFVGPGMVKEKSDKITGTFQWIINAEISYQILPVLRVGGKYLHISNAGKELPNEGLDAMMLSVTIPFGN